MTHILITGGNGYLGAELVRQSLALGWDVTATFHTQPPRDAVARWEALELRDAAAAAALVARCAPDIVIHTAYRQDGPDMASVTADGAAAIARGARAVQARLVHLSSDVVFDGEAFGLYTEIDPPSPVTAYGAAKAAAERMVRAEYPAALVARTSLIYGGPGRLGKHERFILDVADGRADAVFFTNEIRCPVEVGDLAAALLELSIHDYSGILHVAGADVVSRHEFACLVAQACGRETRGLRGGLSPDEPRRPRNCALDSGRAQAMLNTRLRGVREVLGNG